MSIIDSVTKLVSSKADKDADANAATQAAAETKQPARPRKAKNVLTDAEAEKLRQFISGARKNKTFHRDKLREVADIVAKGVPGL